MVVIRVVVGLFLAQFCIECYYVVVVVAAVVVMVPIKSWDG